MRATALIGGDASKPLQRLAEERQRRGWPASHLSPLRSRLESADLFNSQVRQWALGWRNCQGELFMWSTGLSQMAIFKPSSQ